MRSPKATAAQGARGRISVLLADGHGLMRDGLRHILGAQRDINVIAAVGDGSASVREAERHAPQVALLGIAMSGLTGIEAARAILAKSPGVAVVIIAARASPMVFAGALGAGALGCLTSDSSADDLLKAVRAAAAGKRYIGSAAIPGNANRDQISFEPVTATERKILKLVAEGRSNPEVAEVLGLSPRTVETYRLRMMRKLQIDDLPALVKFAIRHGITPLD